jgi:putative ABC transport system substrate-binding protein
MRVIGRINVGAATEPDWSRAALLSGLNETGFFIDRNVSIEFRTADGQVERLPVLAKELVEQKVDLIYGNLSVAIAAKAATGTIPIVFATTTDPVAAGVVNSFNRPGGNVTGVRMRAGYEATAKLVEFIHELLPAATAIGMLIDPNFPDARPDTRAVEAAVQSLGLQVVIAQATTEPEIESAITRLAEAHVRAILIGDNAYFSSLRDRIAALATRCALPIFAGFRSFVVAGAVASYGASDYDGIRQAGIYAGRILKGANPADLPVIQPTKFELVLNPKVASSFGITIPQTILARADEVIE